MLNCFLFDRQLKIMSHKEELLTKLHFTEHI